MVEFGESFRLRYSVAIGFVKLYYVRLGVMGVIWDILTEIDAML